MPELWHPPEPKRTRNIEGDMRAGARPNPYVLTREDVGCYAFGAVTWRDVGKRCQLVWNDDHTAPVFQMQNDEQLLPPSDLKGPVYKHDCMGCVYLGTVEDLSPNGVDVIPWDLYWCKQGDDRNIQMSTVIARWSSRGPDYGSGLPFGKHHPDKPIGVAYQRAADRGLIPYGICECAGCDWRA